MARKSQSLAIVRDERKPEDDSVERFHRRTLHLKTGQGQRLESVLFKLAAEKDARS